MKTVDKDFKEAVEALKKESHALVDETIDDIAKAIIEGKGHPKFRRIATSVDMPHIKLSFGLTFKKK